MALAVDAATNELSVVGSVTATLLVGNMKTIDNEQAIMDNLIHATAFNSPLPEWEAGSVVDMYRMFVYAISFNQTLPPWVTHKVTPMQKMFQGATAFNSSPSRMGR